MYAARNESIGGLGLSLVGSVHYGHVLSPIDVECSAHHADAFPHEEQPRFHVHTP